MALIQILEMIKMGRVNFPFLIWTIIKRIFLNWNWSPCQTKEKGNHFCWKAANNRVEGMTSMFKFSKLKLKESTARSRSQLSVDEIFGKTIATEIKQLQDNVKSLPNKINDVIFKYQMHCNQSTVHELISSPINPSISFTPKHFITPSINARAIGSCKHCQTGSWFNNVNDEIYLFNINNRSSRKIKKYV